MTSPKPRRGNTAKLDAIKAKALLRDTKALKMRVEEFASFDAIGEALGYGGRAGAHRAVKRRLKDIRDKCSEAAEEVRQMELDRLDLAMAAVMPKVLSGDLLALDRLLRVQDRRSSYLGLDVPKQLHVELARNMDAFFERVRGVVPPDVFELLIAAAAGLNGQAEAGGDPGAEAGEVGGRGEGSGDP